MTGATTTMDAPDGDLPPVTPMAAMPSKSRLVRISGLTYALTFIVDFGVSIAVARLLTPQEVGTFSVAMAAIVLTQILRTAGVNVYIVQARTLGPPQVAAALGLAMMISATLGIAVAAASGQIAGFYKEPAMQTVLQVASLGFLLVPIQSVSTGLLMRDLRFGHVAAGSLAGTAVGGTVTVLLALNGFGPVSMAIGAFANISMATAINAWNARASLVWPRLTGCLAVWSISGWVIAGSAVNQFGNRMNELVVGRSLGLSDAAMLDRAEMLPRMVWTYVAPALLAILTPLIAREVRDGADVRTLLIERMRFFSIIFVPVMVGMSTQAENLMLAVFGPQWAPAVPSVFWLCMNGALAGQAIVISSALAAVGRTRLTFAMATTEQLARAGVLLLLANTDILTISQGMIAVGVTYALIAGLCARHAGILYMRDVSHGAVPALISAAVIFVIGLGWNVVNARWLYLPPLPALISAMAVLGVAWLALIWRLEPKLARFGVKVVTGR